MSPRALIPAALLIALVATACTPISPTSPPGTATSPAASPRPAPTASSSAEEAAAYGAIAEQVERIRGLHPTADITPAVIDQAALRRNLEADFDRHNPPDVIAASERILKLLGLIAPGARLRDMVLDLQAGQVIGYYSPERDELFVVSAGPGIGPTQRTTYAHEFTHQLQDQNFGLDTLGLDAIDQGDRSLARLALVEGDAVATQTRWMQEVLTADELAEVFGEAADPEALAALQRAPAFLRQTVLFPYQDGALFVAGLMADGTFKGVDAAYADPPASTEQILHPEKYRAGEAPIAVELAAGLPAELGANWSAGAQDTLGELGLRIWLREGGLTAAEALAAAAGWGGDRLMLLEDAADANAVALVTEWDTASDATEFAAAAAQAIAGLRLHAAVSAAGGGRTVSVALATDDATAKLLLGLLPR